MELELFRHDILQTATCARGTLAVLPQSEDKKTQKLAVGDLSGVVQCVSVKKGELDSAFKTLPAPNAKVTALALGKGRQQQDRIFVAAGNTVKGISKKGKEFFKFNTQITETIKQVAVHEKQLWTTAEYVHNEFSAEGKSTAFYLAPDRINDAELVPMVVGGAGAGAGGGEGEANAKQQQQQAVEEWCPVLACQDRHVRVLAAGSLLYEAPIQSAPVALCAPAITHDPLHRYGPNAREVLVGTEAGTVVQLLLDGGAARQGFTLPNTKKLGAVSALYAGLDLNHSGMTNIVVGREDGSLQVYDCDEQGQQLTQVYSTRLAESIHTLDGGSSVTNSSGNTQGELVVHTFSGKVLAYSPAGGGLLLPEGDKRVHSKGAATDTGSSSSARHAAAVTSQLERLQAEVQQLKSQLDKEKCKFTEKSGDAALLAVAAPFTLQGRARLEPEEACYVLTLEAGSPILVVALSASLPLTLMDVPTNVAITSVCPPDPENGNLTLATYRCQDSTCRVSIKFRVREGHMATGGLLTAYVIPNASTKTCMAVQAQIKPLCLHQRMPTTTTSSSFATAATDDGEDASAAAQTNELVVTGSFGLSDMHRWLSSLVPDLPPQPATAAAAAGDPATAVVTFANTLVPGLTLRARYKAGEACFHAAYLPTLATLRDGIMRAATAAGTRAHAALTTSKPAAQHAAAAIWPLLTAQRDMAAQLALLEGLTELSLQDPEVMEYLAPEHKKVLQNAKAIRAAAREQQASSKGAGGSAGGGAAAGGGQQGGGHMLQHLTLLLKDLYQDYCRYSPGSAAAAAGSMAALEALLADTHTTLQQVTDFITTAGANSRQA